MTDKSGLGSSNMSEADKKKIHSAGGKASSASTSHASSSKATGAAGKTEAAKRGGENSHRGSNA